MSVTYLRHAPSMFNIYGDLSNDVDIVPESYVECSKIDGKYDLIICSNLKRAKTTLEKSNIKCTNILYTDLCRERRAGNTSDYLIGESTPIDDESEENYINRKETFKLLLNQFKSIFSNILVVSHYHFIYDIIGFPMANLGIAKILN